MNWNEAIPETRTNVPTLSSKQGAHSAFYVGYSEPHKDKENCYSCPGPDCKKCGGGGSKVVTKIELKYEMPDGTIEQESMTFKLAPAMTLKNGTVLSSSKLFERFSMFSGLEGPGDLSRWAEQNDEPRIPVTIIIKPNKTGKALKITEVVLRDEPKASRVRDEAPKSYNDLLNRTKEIDPREDLDEEIPF